MICIHLSLIRAAVGDAFLMLNRARLLQHRCAIASKSMNGCTLRISKLLLHVILYRIVADLCNVTMQYSKPAYYQISFNDELNGLLIPSETVTV